jgi:Mn2+/Fe2+ NRAMP family transporter
MDLLNWITLALAVVLWMIAQNIGIGVAMASSAPVETGSPQDILLDRTETLGRIAALGAVVAFICELIPIPVVKTAGTVIVVVSILAVQIVWHLLGASARKHQPSKEEQAIMKARTDERLKSLGWTAQTLPNGNVYWSRPQKQESDDVGEPNRE